MKYKKDSWISTDLINRIKKSISCWAENLVVHEIEFDLQFTEIFRNWLFYGTHQASVQFWNTVFYSREPTNTIKWTDY